MLTALGSKSSRLQGIRSSARFPSILQRLRGTNFPRAPQNHNGTVQRAAACATPILTRLHTQWTRMATLSSLDSGLEAFSRNPAHGSVAALAPRPTA